MSKFDGDITPIVNFVGTSLKRKKDELLLRIFRNATFEFDLEEDDPWRADFHLMIKLPSDAYWDIEEQIGLTAFTNKIKALARPAVDGLDNIVMGNVRVFPIPESDDSWRGGTSRPVQASSDEITRLWASGHFRLFLSHSSHQKVFANHLKEALSRIKIDVFVAHEDIEPNLEWQRQIKLALASCHALFYLATQESNASYWCQQEVGWALGRGIFTTSYSHSSDPAGFAGANQGWKCPDHEVLDIRSKLVSMLVKEDRTEPAMRDPLTQLCQIATNSDQVEFILDKIGHLKTLNAVELDRVSTLLDKDFVKESGQLVEAVQDTLIEFGYPPETSPTAGEIDFDPFAE